MSKPFNAAKKSFDFSKGELNGLVALVCIILILIAFPLCYDYYQSKYDKPSQNELKALQELVLADKFQKNNFANAKAIIENDEEKISTTLFAFDPNTIDLSDWQKLGLSVKQAQSIINYRNKGGKFYKPADLAKMYTITPQKFAELEPYIQIASNHNADGKFASKSFPKKELVIVELNGADTLMLDEIKGVGAAFARRIAKYRDRVGGFYQKEQLLEVYGLDSVKFAEIKNQVRIDASLIKKIEINKVQFNDLKANPYLSYKQINAIINYRKQHGDYRSIEDLKKVILLDKQALERISPYLIY